MCTSTNKAAPAAQALRPGETAYCRRVTPGLGDCAHLRLPIRELLALESIERDQPPLRALAGRIALLRSCELMLCYGLCNAIGNCKRATDRMWRLTSKHIIDEFRSRRPLTATHVHTQTEDRREC